MTNENKLFPGRDVTPRRIKLEAALQKLADACDTVGVMMFDSDDMSPEVAAMQEATLEARALLKE